jgi:hypothetical protein
VLFYWLFLLIAWSVKLRSLISQQIYATHLPFFVAYCVGFTLVWVEFVLEWLVPKKKSAYQALEDEDECPIEYATVFSILTFSWMTPMMRQGYKRYHKINRRRVSKSMGLRAGAQKTSQSLDGDFQSLQWPVFQRVSLQDRL